MAVNCSARAGGGLVRTARRSCNDAGLRRFRPGVSWRFRTYAKTNRKRAPNVVLLQYVGPFLNKLSACKHNLELYIDALEESQASLDALLGKGHWQM